MCIYHHNLSPDCLAKITESSHNSVYNVTKFDLDPGKIQDTMFQNKRKNRVEISFLAEICALGVLIKF